MKDNHSVSGSFKTWTTASFADKFKACLWYNREIKEMSFGGGIAAFFQAAFTSLRKTVSKMSTILELRSVDVKTKASEIKITNADEYGAAMGVLSPKTFKPNVSVGYGTKTRNIIDQVEQFIREADGNQKIVQDLTAYLIKHIGKKIPQVLTGEFNVFDTIEKSITNKSKSEDVKKQLAEAITKLDENVNALLDKAVSVGTITKEYQTALFKNFTESKEQKIKSISDKIAVKIAVLEKMEEQAERKTANIGKTEIQLLDGLASEVSKIPELKQQFNIAGFTDSGKALLLNEVKAGRKLEFYHNYLDSDETKQAIAKEVFEGIGTAGNTQILKDLHRSFSGKHYTFSYGDRVDDAIKQQCDLLNNYDEMLRLKNAAADKTDYLSEIWGKIINSMGDKFKGFAHAKPKDKTKIFTNVLSFMPSQGEHSIATTELTKKYKDLAPATYITDKDGHISSIADHCKYSVHFEKNQDGQMSVFFGYSGSYISLVTDSEPDENSAFKIQKNAVVDYDIKYKLKMEEDGKTVTGITLEDSSRYSIAVFENETQQVQVFENSKKQELQNIIPSAKQH